MKIQSIRAAGLRGVTPEGGWSVELCPDDSVHTPVVVQTDEGLRDVGSAFTNIALVRAAVQLAVWGGASVIATVSSEAKAQAARDAGAQQVIGYRMGDVAARLADITSGRGVDRVVDVAFGANLASTIPALKPNGVLATYASDAVPEPALPFWTLLGKNLRVHFVLVYVMDRAAHATAAADVTCALHDGALRPLVARRYTLITHCFLRDPNGYLIEIQSFHDPAWPAPQHEPIRQLRTVSMRMWISGRPQGKLKYAS